METHFTFPEQLYSLPTTLTRTKLYRMIEGTHEEKVKFIEKHAPYPILPGDVDMVLYIETVSDGVPIMLYTTMDSYFWDRDSSRLYDLTLEDYVVPCCMERGKAFPANDYLLEWSHGDEAEFIAWAGDNSILVIGKPMSMRCVIRPPHDDMPDEFSFEHDIKDILEDSEWSHRFAEYWMPANRENDPRMMWEVPMNETHAGWLRHVFKAISYIEAIRAKGREKRQKPAIESDRPLKRIKNE